MLAPQWSESTPGEPRPESVRDLRVTCPVKYYPLHFELRNGLASVNDKYMTGYERGGIITKPYHTVCDILG